MVKYWAENAIDTVELAIEFLKQGQGACSLLLQMEDVQYLLASWHLGFGSCVGMCVLRLEGSRQAGAKSAVRRSLVVDT